MRLSAWTISGQLVHAKLTKVRNRTGPRRARIRGKMPSSGSRHLPSALRMARTSEVNSWSPGTPRKTTPTGAPPRTRARCGTGDGCPASTTRRRGEVRRVRMTPGCAMLHGPGAFVWHRHDGPTGMVNATFDSDHVPLGAGRCLHARDLDDPADFLPMSALVVQPPPPEPCMSLARAIPRHPAPSSRAPASSKTNASLGPGASAALAALRRRRRRRRRRRGSDRPR